MVDPDPLRARPMARLTLHDRLRVLRRDALARLAAVGRIDAEMLEMVAHTGDALAVLEAETMQDIAPIPGDLR